MVVFVATRIASITALRCLDRRLFDLVTNFERSEKNINFERSLKKVTAVLGLMKTIFFLKK